MSRKTVFIASSAGLLLLLAAGVAWRLFEPAGDGAGRGERGPAAVRVADIERGPIEERRVFTGTLEASARFTVAAQRAGRIESLAVDLADPVTRGQTVARLDAGEARQELRQAEAQLAVAEAQRVEARSGLKIAGRAASRLETLHEQGVTSDTQLDTSRAERLSAEAAAAVAEAEVTRAEAGVRTAEIRLEETDARAVWSLAEGTPDGPRVVAERFVNEGDTVSANAPLFSVVDLDPVDAVVYVTERDYSRLHTGQPAAVDVDAWPGRTFSGHVARVSPVFDSASRQARVEVAVPNPDHALKPGMFARVGVVLDRVDSALRVPASALSSRAGSPAVFVLNAAEDRVALRPVTPGLIDGDWVQVTDAQAAGIAAGDRVVVLGQQLLDDDSPVVVPDDAPDDAERTEAVAEPAAP